MWPSGCAKFLLIDFREKNHRENTAFLVEILSRGSCSVTWRRSYRLWKLALLGRQLPNSYWLSLTSEMTNFSYPYIFFRNEDSYLELPLLFLLVVLCLISPDFATCSMALQKRVVIEVMKRWSTFANLALSTLAPLFFAVFRRHSHYTCYHRFQEIVPFQTCSYLGVFPVF